MLLGHRLLASFFAYYIFRGLVAPQAEEARVAKFSALRPLGEPELTHQLRAESGNFFLADLINEG